MQTLPSGKRIAIKPAKKKKKRERTPSVHDKAAWDFLKDWNTRTDVPEYTNYALRGKCFMRVWHSAKELGGPDALDSETFERLWALRPEQPQTMAMYGKEVVLPRRMRNFGAMYRFSGQDHGAERYPELVHENGAMYPMQLEDYVDFVNIMFGRPGIQYNNCLVNFYEPGDYIGPHSDDESQIVPGSSIFSFTLSPGEERVFKVTPKKFSGALTVGMPHGSFIQMGPGMQTHYKHEVPRRAHYKHRRISVTVRALRE
jgi:alkylated DNA repair dioxygenase AlkB